jgi:hypothetical protein
VAAEFCDRLLQANFGEAFGNLCPESWGRYRIFQYGFAKHLVNKLLQAFSVAIGHIAELLVDVVFQVSNHELCHYSSFCS